MIKFVWNGIKVDGVLYKGSYMHGPWTAASGLPDGTIKLCASGYKGFPRIAGLSVENDSDIMTDYFDTDKITFRPDHPMYKDVLEAHDKQEAHRARQYEKRQQKREGRCA